MNIPMELLQRDKNNLLYMDSFNVMKYPLDIDKRDYTANRYYQNGFYAIPSTNDYIVKYSYTIFTRREVKRIKEMIVKLLNNGKNIHDIDFPIGYTIDKRLDGLIIPYYPNSVTLDSTTVNRNLSDLQSVYMHDDDKLHNFFLLLFDILEKIEEMLDNHIYYTDINPENFMLYHNLLKIIDFDFRYVHFSDKLKGNYKVIIQNYLLLVNELLRKFNFEQRIRLEDMDISETKFYVKSLENKLRRR